MNLVAVDGFKVGWKVSDVKAAGYLSLQPCKARIAHVHFIALKASHSLQENLRKVWMKMCEGV